MTKDTEATKQISIDGKTYNTLGDGPSASGFVDAVFDKMLKEKSPRDDYEKLDNLFLMLLFAVFIFAPMGLLMVLISLYPLN